MDETCSSFLHGRGSKGVSDIHESLSHPVGRVVRCLGSPAWRVEESRICPIVSVRDQSDKAVAYPPINGPSESTYPGHHIRQTVPQRCPRRPEGIEPTASSVPSTVLVLQLLSLGYRGVVSSVLKTGRTHHSWQLVPRARPTRTALPYLCFLETQEIHHRPRPDPVLS